MVIKERLNLQSLQMGKRNSQFNLDHSDLLNAIENFKNSHSNFHLVGNYFNGVSVSDCIQKSRELVRIVNNSLNFNLKLSSHFYHEFQVNSEQY